MAGERWNFTKEQLLNTPSRKNGIENDKELIYRQQAANLIQDMGQRLQVTQLCINTAIVYMHRFYMFHSFQKFHRNAMAAAALFLAAKVEEQPRKLEHVIKVSNICQSKDTPVDTKSEEYLNEAHQLVINESILLQTLGFDLTVDHPHTHVVKTCQLVKATKDLAQTSYFLATNSLHLTTMCLLYKPTIVACVCVHLACKWSKWEIPSSNEGKEWFYYMDESVTTELLEELTQEFLNILDQCPSKLKKKILMWRSGKEREKQMDDSDLPAEKKVKTETPPEKKVKSEPSSTATSASSSKSHPSSHHHTHSNHDRKSAHHKSDHHSTKSSSENISRNATESKPTSLSTNVVPVVKDEPKAEIKSEPVEEVITPAVSPALSLASNASTTKTSFKDYKERKLLEMNKAKELATTVKSEDSREGRHETDSKSTSSRHWTDNIQKPAGENKESHKHSERHVSDILKSIPDVLKHSEPLSSEGQKKEEHGKHREKHRHDSKHPVDSEKHRRSHKHERRHSDKHSNSSKHGDSKSAQHNDLGRQANHDSSLPSSQGSNNEITKLKIKADPTSVPQVNEIGKIRIKTEQGSSPAVVKQEAEVVPGSETKIRIKTEPGISPRIKVDSPHIRGETGISPHLNSPRIKGETGISPSVSQDAASPLKLKINLPKDKSAHQSEQKVPSLKISSKMLTGESQPGEHKSRSEHKSHKSKHSDKEHKHKHHAGTNGKPELKLHISMSAINKHKGDLESKRHHKSSHSDRSSSDEKGSGKHTHSHHKGSKDAHSSSSRKRQMSPNSEAHVKAKVSKTESNSAKVLNRSSSNYSVVSMDLSDTASVDGNVNGSKKRMDHKDLQACQDQIQAMHQVIDMIKSSNPLLATSVPSTPTTPSSAPPLPPPMPSQPPPPLPPSVAPPPPPPPAQMYQSYPAQHFSNQFGTDHQFLQNQFGFQQFPDFDFLSDEAMPPLPSDPPVRPPTPPLGPPPF